MSITIAVGGFLDPAELVQLHKSVGWDKHADPHRAALMLANSDVVVSARDDGQLVGFGRALTDRVLYASIHDVVVAPSHQGRGIGSAIFKAILHELSGVRKISLNTSTGAQEFYQKHGFKPGQDYFELYQW